MGYGERSIQISERYRLGIDMASKRNYKDLDSLLNDLKSDIEDTLSKEVFEEVRDIETEHIQKEVLNRYQPQIYKRRGVGGIDDPQNMVGRVKNMELNVYNMTPFNPGYGTYNSGIGLADLLNEGSGGKSRLYYDFVGEFEQPTHFLENTQYEIDKTKRVENALYDGLKRRGYDTK